MEKPPFGKVIPDGGSLFSVSLFKRRGPSLLYGDLLDPLIVGQKGKSFLMGDRSVHSY